jgi:hypothetical protein
MATSTPSYVAKLSRAEKHLTELEAEIDRYASTEPYAVGEGVEGKSERKVHRLAVTADPADTDIPIIAAEVLYNLRCCLDHLMNVLLAPKDRGKALFPIFFEGVWESPVQGESKKRARKRACWASDIKTLPDDAVTVLKRLQPPAGAGEDREANLLRFLKRLSNRDRREKLPVLVAGLNEMVLRWKLADGTTQAGFGVLESPSDFFKRNAPIHVPDDAVDVEIKGTPVVVIRAGKDKRGRERQLEIPKHLQLAVRLIEENIIPSLSPYVHAGSG